MKYEKYQEVRDVIDLYVKNSVLQDTDEKTLFLKEINVDKLLNVDKDIHKDSKNNNLIINAPVVCMYLVIFIILKEFKRFLYKSTSRLFS